jgi:epoxyqueuosine reductase
VLFRSSGLTAFLPAVERRLADEAALVRGAAVWAAGRLADPERLRRLHAVHTAAERDDSVVAEWTAAGIAAG